MTEYGGQTYVCRNGACYYTWKVYENGQQIGNSVKNSGGTTPRLKVDGKPIEGSLVPYAPAGATVNVECET